MKFEVAGKQAANTIYIVATFAAKEMIRRAVKKSSEMWYSTEMVGHMTTLT